MRKYTTFRCFSSYSRPSTIVATSMYKAQEQHKKLKQTRNRLLSEEVLSQQLPENERSNEQRESKKKNEKTITEKFVTQII